MSLAMKTFSQHEAEMVEMEDRKDMVGTEKDAQEMERLGKQQQLNVCLRKKNTMFRVL